MTRTEQLFPREPRRMKQPTKDVLRDHLARAANEIERLRGIVSAVDQALKPSVHAPALIATGERGMELVNVGVRILSIVTAVIAITLAMKHDPESAFFMALAIWEHLISSQKEK